jgi:hypothetical protein
MLKRYLNKKTKKKKKKTALRKQSIKKIALLLMHIIYWKAIGLKKKAIARGGPHKK